MGAASGYVEVHASPEDCYRYWRDPRRFAGALPDVREVVEREDGTWHWVVEGPLGKAVEWDAEVVEDVPAERIAWRSLRETGDNTVETQGNVQFSPKGRQLTGVTVSLNYEPPGGKAGEIAATLFRDPQEMVERSLESFRELAEGWGLAA